MELLLSLGAGGRETPVPLFCHGEKFFSSEKETALTSAPAPGGPQCQR